jgi:hypothetical protein
VQNEQEGLGRARERRILLKVCFRAKMSIKIGFFTTQKELKMFVSCLMECAMFFPSGTCKKVVGSKFLRI